MPAVIRKQDLQRNCISAGRIHEDYGLFGYEELYSYGEIIVTASKDASMGILLELRGTGCRHLEYVLQARGISWYSFLSRKICNTSWDIQVSQSRWICTLMFLKQEQMWKCEV